MISFTLRPLYLQRKSLQYDLDRRLDGPQSQFGRYGDMNIFGLNGIRTLTIWLSSPSTVAIPTALPLLIEVKQETVLSKFQALSSNHRN
jgi:hypothetical protein